MTITPGLHLRCKRHPARRYRVVGQAAHCPTGQPYWLVRREDTAERYCQALTAREIQARFCEDEGLADPWEEEGHV